MIRRPKEFIGAAGTYTWPRYALEYDATQPLVGSVIDLVGADYVFDQLGDGPALKGPGTHTIRYLLIGLASAIEDEVDDMRAKLFRGARGQLIVEADDGSQRQCPARINAMPDIKLATTDRQRAPVILVFTQFADFQNVDLIDEHDGAVQTIVGSPDTILVTNPGNADVLNAKITLKGTFTNPTITNDSLDVPGSTTPWKFETTRDGAAASDWLEIDVGANTVRFSDDSGATWSDDSDNVVLQDGQVGLFALGPGVNSLTITGAGGADIELAFAGTWV